jgi:hypothetical protein
VAEDSVGEEEDLVAAEAEDSAAVVAAEAVADAEAEDVGAKSIR